MVVLPPAVLVAAAASPAGRSLVVSLAALAPWLPIALFGLLAALCVAGAVLLWRCAFNVDRRILRYFGRALSILALAGIGLAIYAATTGKLLRTAPASVSGAGPGATLHEPRLFATSTGNESGADRSLDA